MTDVVTFVNATTDSVQTKINFFERATVSQRKRRRAVRRVSNDDMKLLRTRLFDKRTAFLNEHPGLGSSFVCPNVTIEEICAQAKFTVYAKTYKLMSKRK